MEVGNGMLHELLTLVNKNIENKVRSKKSAQFLSLALSLSLPPSFSLFHFSLSLSLILSPSSSFLSHSLPFSAVLPKSLKQKYPNF